MKRLIIAASVLAVASGQAMAACPTSNQLSNTAISTLLAPASNPTCTATACTGGIWAHYTGQPNNEMIRETGGSSPNYTGVVYDYKKGPTGVGSDDPSGQVGNFTISSTNGGSIQYSYTGDKNSPYTYTVWGTGSPYTFCNTSGTQYSVSVNTSP